VKLVFIKAKVEVLQKVGLFYLVVAATIETYSDVRWLKVSVNDLLETEFMLSLENLPNNLLGLFFGKYLSLVNKFLQVTVTVFK
jgi:hypothetical protein